MPRFVQRWGGLVGALTVALSCILRPPAPESSGIEAKPGPTLAPAPPPAELAAARQRGAPGDCPDPSGGADVDDSHANALDGGSAQADNVAVNPTPDGWRVTSASLMAHWKPALEGYRPRVTLGNMRPLGRAVVPYAAYLNRIHTRLHPVFTRYLEGISPAGAPQRSSCHLKVNVEMLLEAASGRIVQLGVTRSSGVVAFDLRALEAVHRAAPFGAAAAEIVSPDGNVYIHWELHNLPMFACSTYFARPFILKLPAKR